jgi:hypothetical protein
MAVVQISKIQVRRGQKNSNSGIPQLSSAEFAWAVDSQELFIGNGSVAEGAPYVGNTKILTEHDNILDLASSYQYASDDTSITLSVPRSLQGKLDETVSVADFGAVGDGSTDCVTPFETAFTQLFRNSNSTFKKVLLIPNGEYLFDSDLTIPDGVILRGETPHGVVLNMGASNIRFITSTGLELADFNSTNRPQNISLSNLTIQRTTGQLTLSGVANSIIDGVRFVGEYILDSNISLDLSTEPAAVFWQNNLIGTRVDNILFKNCHFETNSVAVKCLQTEVFDTNIKFDNCKFFVSDTAVYIDGVPAQGNRWQVYDCEFEEISKQAFRSTNGRGTLIQRSRFKNVGNNTSSADNPTDVMIYFGEAVGNVVVDCISDRQQSAGVISSSLTAAYAEVYNGSMASFVDKNYSTIFLSDSFRPLAVFSALNNFTIINYCLTLGEHVRYGTLTLAIGNDLSVGSNGSDVTITDSYTYSPRLITSQGGSLMTNFEFNISKVSNSTGDDSSVLDATADTLLLSYKNPLAAGQTGSISFDVAYGV